MPAPSPEGPADQSEPEPSPESFPEFCRRLFPVTSGEPRSWIASELVDSTNSQGRRFLEVCREAKISSVPPCCFLAWEQSAGRGRRGRHWSSAAGLGLYMTFLLPALSPMKIAQLPLAAAIIAARVLSRRLDEPVRVKWPNDVLSRGRKLAGILVEATSRGVKPAEALVGIGINVHHPREALPIEATSLLLEGSSGRDMVQLAVEISRSLEEFLAAKVPTKELVEDYRGWSQHHVGDPIRCRVGEEVLDGRFVGFDESGALLLECQGRVRKLASSEIVEV